MFAAAVLAAALAIPNVPDAQKGQWVVVAIERVVAPDQHPGECFVQAKVEQVVRGEGYRAGDPIAISMACRAGGMMHTQATRQRGPVSLETLRSQARALVHVDAGGRLFGGDFYGLGQIQPGG